jgi:hypothetical protein
MIERQEEKIKALENTVTLVSAELYSLGNMIYNADKEIKKNEKSKKHLNDLNLDPSQLDQIKEEED